MPNKNKQETIKKVAKKPKSLVPYLSATYPQIIPKKAEPRDATVYPKAVFARVHPNSFDNGFKKTDIEPIVPNERAVRVKTEMTITHP